jgi:hypothetical protein
VYKFDLYLILTAYQLQLENIIPQHYPVKKKIVEKPPRNSAGFCGGGQGLSWAVEPRKE